MNTTTISNVDNESLDLSEQVINAFTAAVADIRMNIIQYVSSPTYFTRKRKISLEKLIEYLVILGSKDTRSEICEYFVGDDQDEPSDAAMCMQRDKLNADALKRVLEVFTSQFKLEKDFMGYRILAVDGSDITIPTDLNDKETLVCVGKKDGKKVYINQVHLHALYDSLNGVYVDSILGTDGKGDEREALMKMVENGLYDRSHSIILADRGYEAYNLIAFLILAGQKFAIRAKDIFSNGILSNKGLPDDAFDMNITIRLVFKQTNYWKEQCRDNPFCIFSPANQRFDFRDPDKDYYDLTFRVCRFKITDDTYECLITNLSKEEMPFIKMINLYHYRWAEETSFRYLKYAIGLRAFHAKKRNSVKQEIYARMVMFNICSVLTDGEAIQEYIDDYNKIVERRKKGSSESQNDLDDTTADISVEAGDAKDAKKENKYESKPDKTTAITNLKLFFKGLITGTTLIRRIYRFRTLIRDNRKEDRPNGRRMPIISQQHRAA